MRSSTSSLHGEGRRDGAVLRLPDPPDLCASRLQTKLILEQKGRRQNPEESTSEDRTVAKTNNAFMESVFSPTVTLCTCDYRS